MKKLKALLINGSPRAKGCTYTALTELKNTLEKEGLQTMRTLGRNIAFMVKSFALGKEQMGLPEKEPLKFTSFHR